MPIRASILRLDRADRSGRRDRGCSSRWCGTRDRRSATSRPEGSRSGVDQPRSARVQSGVVEEVADDEDVEPCCRDLEGLGSRAPAARSHRRRSDPVSTRRRRRSASAAHSIVRPRTITKSTCSSARTSASGSPVDRDQVGRITGRDPAHLPLEAEQPGGAGGRRGDRLGRAHPGQLDQQARIPRRCGHARRPPASVPNTTGTPAARAARAALPTSVSVSRTLASTGGRVDALAEPLADAGEGHQGRHQRGAPVAHRGDRGAVGSTRL